jgi:hypothetical protein
VALELKALRYGAAARLVTEMLSSSEGKEGLLQGLQQAAASDPSLALQIKTLARELSSS